MDDDENGEPSEHTVTIESEAFHDLEEVMTNASVIHRKMTNFESFAACCKGYCAINILILPKQFDNGGWLVGTVSILMGGLLVLICAQKLVKCAIKLHNYSYSHLALKILGPRLKLVVDIFLSLCQFSFTVA